MFISGWPPKEAVPGSELTLPEIRGFRKSTAVVGGLKLKVFRSFCRSQRIWIR